MDILLVRLGRLGVRVPRVVWRRIAANGARHTGRTVAGFTTDHHRVRDYAVTEIARTSRPVTTEQISAETEITADRVLTIIDELEQSRAVFFRSGPAAVDWAYPVTADETPHQVRIDGGAAFSAA